MSFKGARSTMAEEKFRRERKDLPSMPKFTIVMLVLAGLQCLLLVYTHLNESLGEIFWVPAGLAAIVMAVIAGFTWHNTPLVRRVIRTAVIAVPVLMGGIGLGTGIAASITTPDDASYNFTLFTSLGLLWVQLIATFMIPVLLTAASFGGRFDRVLLIVFSAVNAAITPFFFYYTASTTNVPTFYLEEPTPMLGVMLYSAVFTLLTFLPAIASNPERRIAVEK